MTATTDAATFIERASNLHDLIDTNASKADGDPISIETVNALADADLFSVMIPEACGGAELSINDCIDIWAEVSRADGSTGWCLMASTATAAYFGAWCPQPLVDEMFSNGIPLAAGQFAPNGTAVRDDDRGGWRITGQYNFGSGINHAQWAGAGVITEVPEGENPQLLFTIFPVDQAQLLGGWDVLGLQSTASYDYRVDDVFVPDHAAFDLFAIERHRGGPMFDLGVMCLTAAGHSGFAIGVAQRALDELKALASNKQRMGAPSKLAESERFLERLGTIESRLRASSAWVRESFGAAEAHALAGGGADPALINATRQATVFVTQEAAEICREAYLMAGTTALRSGGLQRAFRDIHAGSQHFFASTSPTLDFARDLLADS